MISQMILHVLNMISHVISYYDIIYTFHMKDISKSYIFSYLYDFTDDFMYMKSCVGYDIPYAFICFLALI